MLNARLAILAVCSLWAAAASGCALEPYQPGHGWQIEPKATATASGSNTEPQISEGRPNKLVDGAGWVLGIPGKLLLWDCRVENHAVTADTKSAVAGYLEQNQLCDVCVRVNEYAPGEEWRRLCDNSNVGAGWRYTLGSLSLVGYTLIPGRLVGGDHYNPYTNSVYVYSDVPSLAIKSAAYAKDVHQREYPGTYAVVNGLPVVRLWHETVNTKDALGYVTAYGSPEQLAEAQRILYPLYAMSVGGAVGGIVGAEPIMIAGGAVVGHVSGRLQPPHSPSTGTGVAAESTTLQTSMQVDENAAKQSNSALLQVQQVDGQTPPK